MGLVVYAFEIHFFSLLTIQSLVQDRMVLRDISIGIPVISRIPLSDPWFNTIDIHSTN